MGSAADLIMAGPMDAATIVASDYPLGTFKGVSVDGLDPIKLAALHALLGAVSFEVVVREYQPIAQASPEGPWLVRLPAQLITALGSIAPPDQASVAARWASTEKVAEAAWSTDDADQFLSRLVPFAQSAAFEGNDLFLWIYN